MVKTNNKKRGFSLAEMLVAMLIVSVFFTAATKVMTQRPKKEVVKSPHGFFECYYSGNSLFKQTQKGTSGAEAVRAQNCNFMPPVGLSFINVHFLYDGHYYNFQEVLYDNMFELANPGDIAAYYSQYVEGEAAEHYGKEPVELRNYLRATYPASRILQQWPNEEQAPASALFISW